jgi:adenosylmethionine-8-amino-7-oxononanoate aminotransferase
VRPDIVALAKGAASGYWPLGLAVASGAVHDTIGGAGGFTHGLTYSHHVVGAAAGRAVLRVLRERRLVEAAENQGKRLRAGLETRLGGHPAAGDLRGLGLLQAVELVADRRTGAPFPRAARVAERVVAAARDRGLLLYWSTGCADGSDGDLVMLGPPLVASDPEIDEMADLTAQAVEAALTA